jgi:hypothetical protein
MTTKTVIISGQSFELASPYNEGHVLTAAEANAMNQLRHENIRNNVAKAVKEAYELDTEEAIIAVLEKVAAYDAEYAFRISGTGGSSTRLDPVEREARAIAKAGILNHLQKSGRNFKSVPVDMTTEEWDAKIEAQINILATSDQVLEAARQAIVEKKNRLNSLSDALVL